MEGEQGGNQGTWCPLSGCPREKGKQQERVERVQRDVGQVKSPQVRAEEISVSHQGQPSERKPVSVAKRRKTPLNIPPGQPPLDIGVVGDVDGIVHRHRAEPAGLRVNEHHGNCEKKGQTDGAPPAADAILFLGRPGPLQFPVSIAKTWRRGFQLHCEEWLGSVFVRGRPAEDMHKGLDSSRLSHAARSRYKQGCSHAKPPAASRF